SYYDLSLVPAVVSSTNIPAEFSLNQNYPNPFNPVSTISFALDESGSAEVKVFDINGKEVKTLLRKTNMDPGSYSFSFSGDDLSSGIYFYRLIFTAGGIVKTDSKKMVLVK
ncbi:MAG TPA: T9SS type A sorting domain-containing protein, partial [Ignavibacteria bacterium]|nr:T9SS type A sorting domain-containing protein [Ignavibacteria bacterium]